MGFVGSTGECEWITRSMLVAKRCSGMILGKDEVLVFYLSKLFCGAGRACYRLGFTLFLMSLLGMLFFVASVCPQGG